MQIIGEILDKPLINTPFRMIVSGSSGVGKTIFCKKFLSSNFITKPSKIYYFYNDFYETSPEIWRLQKIPFSPFPGLPSMDFFRSIEDGAVVIIDDQYKNCIKSNGKYFLKITYKWTILSYNICHATSISTLKFQYYTCNPEFV